MRGNNNYVNVCEKTATLLVLRGYQRGGSLRPEVFLVNRKGIRHTAQQFPVNQGRLSHEFLCAQTDGPSN